MIQTAGGNYHITAITPHVDAGRNSSPTGDGGARVVEIMVFASVWGNGGKGHRQNQALLLPVGQGIETVAAVLVVYIKRKPATCLAGRHSDIGGRVCAPQPSNRLWLSGSVLEATFVNGGFVERPQRKNRYAVVCVF